MNPDEWQSDKKGRWFRPGHPEEGVTTLREGFTLADLKAKREAEAEKAPEPTSDQRIAALEARLKALEGRLPTKGNADIVTSPPDKETPGEVIQPVR